MDDAVAPESTAGFATGQRVTATDTPDTLDYDRLARAVDGIEAVMLALDGDNTKGQ